MEQASVTDDEEAARGTLGQLDREDNADNPGDWTENGGNWARLSTPQLNAPGEGCKANGKGKGPTDKGKREECISWRILGQT